MSTSSSITTLILTFFFICLANKPLSTAVQISRYFILNSFDLWNNDGYKNVGPILTQFWSTPAGMSPPWELKKIWFGATTWTPIINCRMLSTRIRHSWIARNKWKTSFTKVSYVFQWNIDFFTHNNDFTQIYSSIPEHWLGCCNSSSNVLLNYRIDVFVTLRGPRFFLFRWNSYLFHS